MRLRGGIVLELTNDGKYARSCSGLVLLKMIKKCHGVDMPMLLPYRLEEST